MVAEKLNLIRQFFAKENGNLIEICHSTIDPDSLFPTLLATQFKNQLRSIEEPNNQLIETRIFILGFDTCFKSLSILIDRIEKFNPTVFITPSDLYPVPFIHSDNSNKTLFHQQRNFLQEKVTPLFQVGHNDALFSLIKTLLSEVAVQPLIIEGLRLNKIGIFDSLELNFHPRLTAICGLNGSGKTTIMRALALSLIGPHHNSLAQDKIQEMFRIAHAGTPESNAIGSIENRCFISNKEMTNHVSFHPIPTEEIIQIKATGIGAGLFSGESMKSLVLGFGQKRELDAKKPQAKLLQFHPPKAGDLIPLINHDSANGLTRFISWIANLDNNASKNSTSRQLIDLAFKLFSQIAGTEDGFAFLELKSVDPLDVWIRTPESPYGIPYHLAGQGCQSVMGWVGYLLQRLAEVYPRNQNFHEQPFVALVDEVDAYLHPLWQRNILKVLLDFFPRGQFIVTTHSPLVIEGLDDFHFIRLETTKQGGVAHQEDLITLGWNYNQVLHQLFKVDPLSHVSRQKFERQMNDLKTRIAALETIKERDPDQEEDLAKQKTALHLMEQSVIARDELDQARARLAQREQKLDDLIAKLEGRG